MIRVRRMRKIKGERSRTKIARRKTRAYKLARQLKESKWTPSESL